MHEVVDQVEEQRDKVEDPASPQHPSDMSRCDGANFLRFNEIYLNVFHEKYCPDCQSRRESRVICPHCFKTTYPKFVKVMTPL